MWGVEQALRSLFVNIARRLGLEETTTHEHNLETQAHSAPPSAWLFVADGNQRWTGGTQGPPQQRPLEAFGERRAPQGAARSPLGRAVTPARTAAKAGAICAGASRWQNVGASAVYFERPSQSVQSDTCGLCGCQATGQSTRSQSRQAPRQRSFSPCANPGCPRLGSRCDYSQARAHRAVW